MALAGLSRARCWYDICRAPAKVHEAVPMTNSNPFGLMASLGLHMPDVFFKTQDHGRLSTENAQLKMENEQLKNERIDLKEKILENRLSTEKSTFKQ